ncbi:MAG: hypothetical protein QGF46_00170 [Planctomycetota bacterium]|jgi:hypothetical protein|nr:hypothetical protein [Planctomycetota bacterium]
MAVRLDAKTAKALVSDDVVTSLEMFRHTTDPDLRILENFVSMHGKKIGGAMLDLRTVRLRSAQKFERGQDMFFTKALLEQASSYPVAKYRAQRFVDAGFKSVVDACCGCGSDSIILAQSGLDVKSYDINEVSAIFAEKNTHVCEVAHKVTVAAADCTEVELEPGPIMLDPARRLGSKRIINPEQWSPQPAAIHELIKGRPGACLKLSPSTDVELLLELFPTPDEIEVISYRGEAKEMVFWYGSLASGCDRRATILPDSDTICGPVQAQAETADEIGNYIFDPNPALVRSGLIGKLAEELSLKNIDPYIGYLTGDAKTQSPFLTSMKVWGVESLDPRKIRNLMKEHQVGSIQVRKRGISESPVALKRRFLPKPYGEKHFSFIATRVGDRHIGILAEVIE